MPATDDRRLLEERLTALTALSASTLALRNALVEDADLDRVDELMRERSTAVAAVLSLPPLPARAFTGEHAHLVADCDRLAREDAEAAAAAHDLLTERQRRLGAAVREAIKGARAYHRAPRQGTGARLETEG